MMNNSEIDLIRKQADSLFKSNKFEEALVSYDKIPEVLQSINVMTNKSSCHTHMNQFELAERVALRVIAHEPSFAKV